MSKLLEKIANVFNQKKESARDRYFAALRKRDAAAAVEAAGEAGILQEQIAADVRALERAEVLRPAAEKLAGVTADRASLVKAFEGAQRELDEAIARLQPLALQAAMNARAAEELERQTRQQVNELRRLFADNPELLPLDTAPAAVKALNAQDSTAEAETAAKLAKQRRMQAARERLETARTALGRTGQAVASKTYGLANVLNPTDPSRVAAQTEAAAAELAAAETEYDDAAAALGSHQ